MFILPIKKLKIPLSTFLIFILAAQCSDPSSEVEHNDFAQAENQNIDSNLLAGAFNDAAEIADLQGLAVARNAVIVAEQYYNDAGPEADEDLHVMSVTKSISATLIGIAIEQGYINSVDQTLSDFLGKEVDATNPELGAVTIDQLLKMSCGHDWQELGSYSEFGDFASAPDQLDYIIAKAIVNTPGTVFNYSDGAAHLISAIIGAATGMSASAFADQNLFGPMGLGERIWYDDNREIPYGGVGLCIGIHDMLKIGFLYLNRGNFNGRQIVPAEWIENVTRFHISTNREIPFLYDYGYYWWLSSAHGHNFICANGYGGQFILVAKDLNLVVASRTNWRGISRQRAGENWWNILNIIINQILPAVRT
jgi:CubicO group peptidase (beta-lactamase class C family)